jgi:predicted small lipoprotein YifL
MSGVRALLEKGVTGKGVRALFASRAAAADRRAVATIGAASTRSGKKGSDPFSGEPFFRKGSDPLLKACAVAVLAALAACGQKGPLVLPDRTATPPSSTAAGDESDERRGDDGR